MESFSIAETFEKKYRSFDADLANGVFLSFEVRGQSDASVCITDATEMKETHSSSESGSQVPVYLVRFANYQNTKTVLDVRHRGRVRVVRHHNLMDEEKYVPLWANLWFDDAREYLCAGFGSPSRATTILSYVGERSSAPLTRVGFTTWAGRLDFRNVVIETRPLRAADMWPLAPAAAPPSDAGPPPLWLDDPNTLEISLPAAAGGGVEGRVRCPALLAFVSSPLIRSKVGDLMRLPGLSTRQPTLAVRLTVGDVPSLQSWLASVIPGARPSAREAALYGPGPLELLDAAQQAGAARARDLGFLTDASIRVSTGPGAGGQASQPVHSWVVARLPFFSLAFGNPFFAEAAAREVTFPFVGTATSPGLLADCLVRAVYARCLGRDVAGVSDLLRDVDNAGLLRLIDRGHLLGLSQFVAVADEHLAGRVTAEFSHRRFAAVSPDEAADPEALALLRGAADVATAVGLPATRAAVVGGVSRLLARHSARPEKLLPLVRCLSPDLVVDALRHDDVACHTFADLFLVCCYLKCKGPYACPCGLDGEAAPSDAGPSDEEGDAARLSSVWVHGLFRALGNVRLEASEQAALASLLPCCPVVRDFFQRGNPRALPAAEDSAPPERAAAADGSGDSPSESTDDSSLGLDPSFLSRFRVHTSSRSPTRPQLHLRPGGRGLLADLAKTYAGDNIVKSGLVSVASSSSKNPMSSGWKLFVTRAPKVTFLATATHPRPFAAVQFETKVFRQLTHYAIGQGAAHDAAVRSWRLEGRTAAGAWLHLDEQTDVPVSKPNVPMHFTVSCAHADPLTEIRLTSLDAPELGMTLTKLDFYGFVENSS
ncbi:hypothetical protein DIPPA_23106 [Diplonema papillatum]|nr:hypothetical protein DIPPA_23106 [Diplonema papillatum]|eukprot:gene17970-27664_t